MRSINLQETTLSMHSIAFDSSDLRGAIASSWPGDDAVLVGHAYDGVIWGVVKNGTVTTARDRIGAEGTQLRSETLLRLHIFDDKHELRVWRSDGKLSACLVAEAPEGDVDFAGFSDERYELLRQPQKSRSLTADEFVRFDGLAGQLHTPPGQPVPRWLKVRHYYTKHTETGLLREAEHRLLALEPETTS